MSDRLIFFKDFSNREASIINPLLTHVILRLAFSPVVIWLLILLPAGTNNFW